METINTLLALDPNYILIVLLVLFFMLETFFNRGERVGSKINHLINNGLFQLLAIAVGSILGWMVVSTYSWIEANNFGLFNMIDMPYWLKVTLGVFLIDFADYWFHILDHKSPFLWRQHRVHHSDTSMDSSTSLRTFPTELFYFTFGELIISVLFGIDIMSMSIFLFLLVPLFILHHTSVIFPTWVDRIFGWLFMTPNYHKVHHEQDQFYTDSNYGTLFIIWDKLFGTFKIKPVSEITYGLKEFTGPEKQSFLYQLRSPFLSTKKITEDHN